MNTNSWLNPELTRILRYTCHIPSRLSKQLEWCYSHLKPPNNTGIALRYAPTQCYVLILAAIAAAPVVARSQSPAELSSVRIVPGDNGPVLTIVSTRPLTPKLQI